jgi:hypothetical protein
VGIAGRPRHIVDRGVVLDLVGVAAPDRDGVQVAVARELDILDVAVLQRAVAAPSNTTPYWLLERIR